MTKRLRTIIISSAISVIIPASWRVKDFEMRQVRRNQKRVAKIEHKVHSKKGVGRPSGPSVSGSRGGGARVDVSRRD